MSLWVGIAASACDFGGQVSGADLVGAAVGLGSGSPAAAGGAGTVWAHDGAGFCIGTAALGSVSSSAGGASPAGASASAHDGATFCMGSAVLGFASSVAWRASVPRGGAAWPSAGSPVADAAASACRGSSGSVSGSKAGVTRGSSGSVWSCGCESLSCRSIGRSVYRRGNNAAAHLYATRTRSSAHLRQSGPAAARPSRRHQRLRHRIPPVCARGRRPSANLAR